MWFVDCLIGWLALWLHGWLFDWGIGQLIDVLVWLMAWLVGWLFCRLVGAFVRLRCLLVGWSVWRPTHLFDTLLCWLVDRLDCWSDRRLVGVFANLLGARRLIGSLALFVEYLIGELLYYCRSVGCILIGWLTCWWLAVLRVLNSW